MKVKSCFLYLPVFFCFIFFNSCSSDENIVENNPDDEISENETEEDLERYFTLNIEEDYFSNGSQNWVVIHFSNGSIADYRAIANGNNYNFEKLPSEINNKNAFNVTFISSELSNNNRFNNISTITLVGKGDVYMLKKPAQNPDNSDNELVGTFNLNVQGLISPASTTISYKGGPIGGGGSSEVVNGLTNSSFFDINLYNQSSYLFSTYDIFGRGSYSFLDNISDGSDITIDRTQLEPYDTTVGVSIPEGGEFFAQVLAFEENQVISPGGGYVSCLVFPFDNNNFTTNLFELGYLNNFDNYYTLFTFENEDFYYYYKKIGEKPISINVPQGNFDTTVNIIDDSLTQFFSYESPLDALSSRKRAFWSTKSGVFGEDYVRTEWTFLTGQNLIFPITSSLPDEILQNNPSMDIENLEYEGMQFFLSDVSYYDYINAVFVENNENIENNLEYIRVLN